MTPRRCFVTAWQAGARHLQTGEMLLQAGGGLGTEDHGADDAFAVDEEGGGGGSHVVERHDFLVVVDEDGIGEVVLLYKLSGGGAIVHAVYSEDNEVFAAGLLSCVELLQGWCFLQAAGAGGVPEIEHDGLSAIIAQADLVSIRRGQGEIGGAVADGIAGGGAARRGGRQEQAKRDDGGAAENSQANNNGLYARLLFRRLHR